MHLQMNLSLLIVINACKMLVIQVETVGHHVNRESHFVLNNEVESSDRSADTAADVESPVKAYRKDMESDFAKLTQESGQNMKDIRPKRQNLEDNNHKLTDLGSLETQLTAMEKKLMKRIVSQNEMIKDLATQVGDVIRTTKALQNTIDAKVIGSERLEQKRATSFSDAFLKPGARKQLQKMMREVNQLSYFLATTMIKNEDIPYVPRCVGNNSDIVSCLRPRISDMYDLLKIPVRIAGGKYPHEGRVEVYIGGKFSTICNEGWDSKDALVVCKMLGYSRGQVLEGEIFMRGAYFKGGRGIQRLSEVACTGDEDNILACPYSTPSMDCSHFYDAGVRCKK